MTTMTTQRLLSLLLFATTPITTTSSSVTHEEIPQLQLIQLQASQHMMTTMCTTESCSDTDDSTKMPSSGVDVSGIKGSSQMGSSGDQDDNGNNNNKDNNHSDIGCKEYTTPLNQCYNGRTLFPDDPSWSEFDIYDTLVMMSLKRRFFKSRDGSCEGWNPDDEDNKNDNRGSNESGEEDDSFVLPFDACVGPFGPPRPWGKFTLIDDPLSIEIIDYSVQ